MKASVKLRTEEQKPPLLRANLPISYLGLPLVSSATASFAGDPDDLSFRLRTALHGGPSLELSFRPHHRLSPFSLSVRSGVGLWGSPQRSPLLISAHLHLPCSLSAAAAGDAVAAISFSILFKLQMGDFSIKKTTRSCANPQTRHRNENGGGVYHPLPLPPVRPVERASVDELLSSSGLCVAAKTTLPVFCRSAVKLRWALNFPPAAGDPVWRRRFPFFTLNKMSFLAVKKDEGDEKIKEPQTTKMAQTRSSISDSDSEAIGDLKAWMGTEVDELQRENREIRESIEQVWRTVWDQRGTWTVDGSSFSMEDSMANVRDDRKKN